MTTVDSWTGESSGRFSTTFKSMFKPRLVLPATEKVHSLHVKLSACRDYARSCCVAPLILLKIYGVFVFPLQELNAIFEKIDTDRSGLIDFDEFVTGVAKFVLEKSPTNGASRYAALDANRVITYLPVDRMVPSTSGHLRPALHVCLQSM